MSLPKNKKRRGETQTSNKEKPDHVLASSQGIESNKKSDMTLEDSARNNQMIKAFEIVEHIEQVQGIRDNNEQKTSGSSSISPVNNQESVNTKRLHVNVSFSSTPDKSISAHNRTGEENMPIIEVKFKIPSFFRKVPILKGITDTLIRRFAKD
jgi:hypothetical protein